MTTTRQSILDIMQSRGSVRAFEKGRIIPEATMHEILKITASAPSAWNLQHWRFIIIEDQKIKEQLQPIAYGQQQVVDAPAVIIILGDIRANENADYIMREAVKEGLMTEGAKATLSKNIEQYYNSNENVGAHEAIRNASLAAMQFMLTAKAYDLDTCPMIGFDAEALRKELNIPDRYLPVIMLPIGYAAQPARATSRLNIEDLIIKNKFKSGFTLGGS